MIQPRSYNTTYFRPKQQCNAILVVVVCLSTIGDIIDCQDTYERLYLIRLPYFKILIKLS